MALRKIVVEGDEVLRKRSREVSQVDDRIRMILDDMLETMRDYDGVGIAAPQVGILKRIFIVEAEEGDVLEAVNPEILSMEGLVAGEEGCLSVPGYFGTVERPEKVRLRAQDRNGEFFEIEAEGLKAVAICHEYDHLEGVLFTDKASGIREAGEE
jgi:peptide deformylase